MHRIWGFSLFLLSFRVFFLAISIAVKQHFLRLKTRAMNDERRRRRKRSQRKNHGQKMKFGRRKSKHANERKIKTDFLFAVQMCNLQKSTGHWPYHENTFIVSCFASNSQTQPTNQHPSLFFNMFFFRCAVSRLFRLDCLVFLILQVFFGCAVVICIVLAATTHTAAHLLCISAAQSQNSDSVWCS